MKLAGLRWVRYRLPFAAGFRTAHGVMRRREGLILWLITTDGAIGIGDAAPLPEFGGGNLAQTESVLHALAPELHGVDLADLFTLIDARLGERPQTAALRCGLDTALFDLCSRRQGKPLAALLSDEPLAEAVVVNATIGDEDTARAVAAARNAVDRGFRTIKLKIGMAGDVAGEVRRVVAVRTTLGPDVILRLDANGVWPPDEAIVVLNALAAYDIEFVEQPVAAHDVDGLARVRRSSPIAIAADEALTSVAAARRIIQQEAADVLIIKPMVCGGLRAGRTIIECAIAAGRRVVVTSTIESGIGVAAALHLAAALPAESPACGLATGSLLVSDLLAQPLSLVNGRLSLPETAGLGVELDEAALARFGYER